MTWVVGPLSDNLNQILSEYCSLSSLVTVELADIVISCNRFYSTSPSVCGWP